MITAFPMPGRGMAALHLALGGGAAAEPAYRGGLAKVLAAWCAQNEKLVDQLERQGATLRGDADHDGAWLTAVCPGERLRDVAPLLAEAVTTPPSGDPGMVISRRLAALRSERSHPLHRARGAFRELAYAPGSAYGRNPGGTEETVRALHAAALFEHHELTYGPANAHLLVVADPRWHDIPDVLASWGHDVVPQARPPIARTPGAGWLLVPALGASQAMLILGGAVITDTPAALEVAVHTLSGWPGSRLTRVLRQELGATYGIYAEVVVRRAPAGQSAEIQIHGSIEAAALPDALARLLRECESLGELADEEITRARDNLADRELLLTQTVEHVVSATGSRLRRGHLLKELAGRAQAVREVTPDEVRKAAAEHLAPDRLVLAAVGDPEMCEPALGPQAERLSVCFSRP